MLLTTELGKGTMVRLRNGMRARLEDNLKRQSCRLATVYGEEVGLFTEMGSVHASDIQFAQVEDGRWVEVLATPKQQAQARARKLYGF